MKKQKWMAVLLSVVMCLSIAGCSSNGESQTETKQNEPEAVVEETAAETVEKDTLVVRVSKDIGDLNPHTMKSQMAAQDWVYESLTGLENGEVVPRLAEKWEISEDGLTYTFHLREGVKFSDGSDFNAEIARKNIEAVRNHAENYSFLNSLTSVTGVEAVDENTLVLTLSQPCNALLSDFSFTRPLVMLGEAGFPAEGDPYDNGIVSPIGTGKWVLKEYVADQYALFERNEYYWGEKPSFQYMKAVVIPDVNTAATALKAGEIDVMMDYTQITADIYNDMAAAGFQTAMVSTTSVSNLNINTAGDITGDLKVRQAMAYATDNTAISEGIFGGLQEPASTYFSSQVPYTDVGLSPYTYDVAKADALLEEAGWVYEDGSEVRSKDGEKLSLDLIYDSSVTNDRDIGLILKSQYAEVGIELNIVPQDSQVYRENWKTGNFDVLIYGSWGGSYEPFATLAAMASDGDKFNTVQKGMSNKAELDEVMRNCLSEPDPDKLAENFDYIVRSFHDQAVYVPLTIVSKLAVYSSDLTGLEMDSNHYVMEVDQLRLAN